MTGFKKIIAFSSEGLIRGTGGRVKRTRQNDNMKPGAASIGTETTLCICSSQPLGIEAEFLGHLDQLLRGFRILDGFGELPGSVGLIAVVVGLGHRSTFLDKYGLRQKGSTSGT